MFFNTKQKLNLRSKLRERNEVGDDGAGEREKKRRWWGRKGKRVKREKTYKKIRKKKNK